MKTTGTASPTETEIATVAYQLWLDNGCRVGSDQEDWFRAEVMLKNALITNVEDLSGSLSILHCDTRSESEMLAEFASERWLGHWEVWEREWVGPRWVWDLGHGVNAASSAKLWSA